MVSPSRQEKTMTEPRNSRWRVRIWTPDFQWPFGGTYDSYGEACDAAKDLQRKHPDYTGGSITEEPRLGSWRTKKLPKKARRPRIDPHEHQGSLHSGLESRGRSQ